MSVVTVVGDPEPRSRTYEAVLLEPVLVELGATCATRGPYLLDSAYDEAALEPWLGPAPGQVAAARAGLR